MLFHDLIGLFVNCIEKTKIKKKGPRMALLKKWFIWSILLFVLQICHWFANIENKIWPNVVILLL